MLTRIAVWGKQGSVSREDDGTVSVTKERWRPGRPRRLPRGVRPPYRPVHHGLFSFFPVGMERGGRRSKRRGVAEAAKSSAEQRPSARSHWRAGQQAVARCLGLYSTFSRPRSLVRLGLVLVPIRGAGWPLMPRHVFAWLDRVGPAQACVVSRELGRRRPGPRTSQVGLRPKCRAYTSQVCNWSGGFCAS